MAIVGHILINSSDLSEGREFQIAPWIAPWERGILTKLTKQEMKNLILLNPNHL